MRFASSHRNLKEMGGVKPVTTLQRWETSPEIYSARFFYNPDPGQFVPAGICGSTDGWHFMHCRGTATE
jgi:hypothetical protein